MIVTAVLAIGTLAAFYFTKPIPVQPPQPEAVVVAPPQLPTGDVVMANSLPNASGGAVAGGGGGASPAGFGGRGGGGGAGAGAGERRGPVGVAAAGG